MRRRGVIAAAAVIASRPLALAQENAPLVAFLVHGSLGPNRARLEAFREGMKLRGHVEGRSYRLELRFSEARIEHLPELARELAPDARRVMAVSSGHALVEADVRRAARIAADALGLTIIDAWAETAAQIPQLAELCRREACAAILILLDPTLFDFRKQLIDVTAALGVPAIYSATEFATDGGLCAYGADTLALFRRAAAYVDRILKGARPGDLPIEQPTAFNLVINLRAAKAIGLTVPSIAAWTSRDATASPTRKSRNLPAG